jgi:hypothetical protein
MTAGLLVFCASLLAADAPVPAPARAPAEGLEGLEIAALKPAVPMESVSAFWNVDLQYRDQPRLNRHSRVKIADLKGPGVITFFHMTGIHALAKRGLLRAAVLEIYFDGAPEPAVLCPLPDFFGDGCNGKSESFASRFVEKVPWAWNAYFPMPFRKSAQVIIRNDSDFDTMSYAFLEWRALPEARPDLGYFHATYRRKAFRLTNDTREEFWRARGRGHFLGRQLSIASDDARFSGFSFIMEGNNEVDVDGRRRAFDYLGSEDSFTFSWGFNKIYASPRVGMTHLVMDGSRSRLSIYRFHQHMPIRFDREISWTIDWRSEDPGFGKQSGWVDYASVFYWYGDDPGHAHDPLPPVDERCLDIIPAPEKTPNLKGAIEKLAPDPALANGFDAAADLGRVAVLQAWPKTHPFWIDVPEPKGGHPGQPNPGRRGILAVHPEGTDTPCFVLRKVALPAGPSKLRLVVSGDPYEVPGKSDFLVRAGILDGGEVRWLGKVEAVDAGDPPGEKNWRTLEFPLSADLAGKTAGIVVKVAYGGPKTPGQNEEAFFDEISVVEAK